LRFRDPPMLMSIVAVSLSLIFFITTNVCIIV
jgi:hypothetical protein